MHAHADRTKENHSKSVASRFSKSQSGGQATSRLVDKRPEVIAQRKLQEMANDSLQVKQYQAYQEMANHSHQVRKTASLQEMAANHSATITKGRKNTAEEEPLQGEIEPVEKRENTTGMPDRLKAGLEQLSGLDLSGVRVHYNSAKPAQLHALAYTQGKDIYVGPGQKPHLPHEGWHTVQQMQGIVEPTIQAEGVAINDDTALEHEADVMGTKALLMRRPDHALTGSVAQGGTAVQDIFFRQGAYAPGNRRGQEFLAHELTHVVQQRDGRGTSSIGERGRAVSDVVQRKTGFEFEDNAWKSWLLDRDLTTGEKAWARTPLIGGALSNLAWPQEGEGTVKPAKKRDVLHQETHFTLEADNYDGRGDIEFVTDAFEEDEAGFAQLKQVLRDIEVIMNRISPRHGRRAERGEYVWPFEHKFSNQRALLSRGWDTPGFSMQATQGLRLRELPLYLESFGLGVHAESAEQREERWSGRRVMYGPNFRADAPGKISGPLGMAPHFADAAIGFVRDNHAVEGEAEALQAGEAVERLRGFLAMVINYVKMLSHEETGYIKAMVPLMSRTKLSKLFEYLPEIQQGILKRENCSALKAAVVHAANLRDFSRDGSDSGYTEGRPLIPNFRPANYPVAPGEPAPVVLGGLQIGTWLEGLTDGKDYLNKEDMADLLTEQGVEHEEVERRVKYLGGLGSMGEHTEADIRGNEDVTRFENRYIVYRPGHGNALTVEQITNAALQYFEVMMALRAQWHP